MFIFSKKLVLFYLFTILTLFSCKGIGDDLNPSDDDERSSSTDQVGEVISDFSVTSSNNEVVSLNDLLQGKDAVVLYFTMWCPICNSHTDDIQNNLLGRYPNVSFYLVDYISGNLADGYLNLLSSGYDGSFVALVDTENTIENLVNGNMGSTIVINANKEILLNEYYKRNRLEDVLNDI